MSKRHRDTRPARDHKEVRQLQHRRFRHRAGQVLREADVEAVVLADPRVDHPDRTPPSGPTRRRHWKVKDWKRRNLRRAQRNAAMAALLQEP